MNNWKLRRFSGADKTLYIDAGDVSVMIDFDDVDHDEAEMVARFIASKGSEYEQWKAREQLAKRGG